jgi:hypothetical protein
MQSARSKQVDFIGELKQERILKTQQYANVRLKIRCAIHLGVFEFSLVTPL